MSLSSEESVSSYDDDVTPKAIIDTTYAFAQSVVFLTAIELDLFTAIAHGYTTLEALAAHVEADAPSLERLLGTLHAMGFVIEKSDHYELTPVSAGYLLSDSSFYLGGIPLQIRQEWDAWIHLTTAVKTGKSVRVIDDEELGGTFFAPLSEHLFPLIYPLMQSVCDRLNFGALTENPRVLDLGAGTAPAIIAALEANPSASAVAVDFANVLEHAKAHIQEHGLQDRVEYLPVDLKQLEVPSQQFDLVFASHTFRILGADLTYKLIRQTYDALKPGGRFVIIETYKEPQNNEELFPHIVSINMFVNTRHGDAYTVPQMREWLTTTGFEIEEWWDLGPDLILVATRK